MMMEISSPKEYGGGMIVNKNINMKHLPFAIMCRKCDSLKNVKIRIEDSYSSRNDTYTEFMEIYCKKCGATLDRFDLLA